jgi:hypothetical protein
MAHQSQRRSNFFHGFARFVDSLIAVGAGLQLMNSGVDFIAYNATQPVRDGLSVLETVTHPPVRIVADFIIAIAVR